MTTAMSIHHAYGPADDNSIFFLSLSLSHPQKLFRRAKEKWQRIGFWVRKRRPPRRALRQFNRPRHHRRIRSDRFRNCTRPTASGRRPPSPWPTAWPTTTTSARPRHCCKATTAKRSSLGLHATTTLLFFYIHIYTYVHLLVTPLRKSKSKTVFPPSSSFHRRLLLFLFPPTSARVRVCVYRFAVFTTCCRPPSLQILLSSTYNTRLPSVARGPTTSDPEAKPTSAISHSRAMPRASFNRPDTVTRQHGGPTSSRPTKDPQTPVGDLQRPTDL